MKKLMLGNEAVARGAFEAGVAVASSYPGTPSTEITEYLSTYDSIYSEWAPNEKVAVETAAGASLAGARALSAMKHVGLNVAADPLFTASYTGINAGLVICVADDPGMHSSQNEQDSRHYAKAAKLPMLEPSSAAECKEYVKKAYELSEAYDTPVLIRLSTRISHTRGIVDEETPTDVSPRSYTRNPDKYVMMPAMARKRHVIVEDRINKLQGYAETSPFNTVECGKGEIGFITGGTAYNYAKEAFGESASYLKLGMTYPLPEKLIRDFAKNVRTVFVIEELDPFIEDHCRQLGVDVIGKDILPLTGEYTPSLIRQAVESVLPSVKDDTSACPALQDAPDSAQIPGRPPVMCAGCPHRAAFTALKQLNLNVSGDIGCYTLAALPVMSTLHSCLCMGASVGIAHGMEKANPELSKNTVAVIGDSTFIHSGITGLINAVYNKGRSTIIILDNSTTGMTGHQENPTTGKTIKGEATAQVNLEALCRAVGVNRVVTVDPFELDAFKAIIKEETATDEVSVIIARRPCALLKTTKPGPKYQVTEKCKNCMACMKIGCPAIGRSNNAVSIDNSLCQGCGYCTKVCGFNAIE